MVEPVDGTLKVHDAPLGVMTNAPAYDWQMTNLANNVYFSVNDIESAKVGDIKVEALGAGSGLLGLPGDFTPPSRFVRPPSTASRRRPTPRPRTPRSRPSIS
ncbi:MAG: linear amide C-N hydrolase [Methyloceanibacter sp.]